MITKFKKKSKHQKKSNLNIKENKIKNIQKFYNKIQL